MENQDIKRISNLAKLIIDDKEEHKFVENLKSIMNMINKLQKVDCSNIEPLTSVCEMNLRVREDFVNDGNQEDQVLFNSPGNKAELAKTTHFFIVPKVVE
jgi:aspartyl-tRNA(Asn)/glutamyl-tRNA(Gln) amidotransferase subunit C